MTRQARPTIRTLPQLHDALAALVDDRYGSVTAEAKKHVVTGVRATTQYTLTFHSATLTWRAARADADLADPRN